MDHVSSRWPRLALYILSGLAVIAALEFAQGILAPIFAAVVVGVILSPLTDRMCAAGLRPSGAAFVAMLLFAALAAALVVALEPSISAAIQQAPVVWLEFRSLLEMARDAVSGLRDFQQTVTDTLNDEPGAGASPGGEAEETELPVPNLFQALSYGPTVLGAILVFVGTLYFFLATRTELYAQIARAVSGLETAKLHAAERQVSRYFLTITCINAVFGICVTLAMMLLGMPQPSVWGIATFLLNYLLYLGPAMVAGALLVVGVVTFDGAMSFAPMAVFLMFNMVEAQFATPTLVGRHMSLNPLFVFLSLVIWLWLWGPIGGLVAIPVLVWILFMADAHAVTEKNPRVDDPEVS